MSFTLQISHIIMLIVIFPVILSILNSAESTEENNDATDHDDSRSTLKDIHVHLIMLLFLAGFLYVIYVICRLIWKKWRDRHLDRDLELEEIQRRRRLSVPRYTSVLYNDNQDEDEDEEEYEDEPSPERSEQSEERSTVTRYRTASERSKSVDLDEIELRSLPGTSRCLSSSSSSIII